MSGRRVRSGAGRSTRLATLRGPVRLAAGTALRVPAVERLALRGASRRQRGIALVWHRVAPAGAQPHEVVPTVATETFERQLDLIAELGEVVPLAQLEQPAELDRPRFALTFDDDDPGHVRFTLPVLAARGLPATFFLSGRWRYAGGPYWWEVLEDAIRREGVSAVARRYGLSSQLTPMRLAEALAGTAAARHLADEGHRREGPTMQAADAAALVKAGMEIGFHTVDHPVLPLLTTDALHDALDRGRSELSTELGTPVLRLAYPHGRADRRVARIAATLGYTSGWTTKKIVGAPGDDHMLRGRWDVSSLPLAAIRVRLLRALARAAL